MWPVAGVAVRVTLVPLLQEVVFAFRVPLMGVGIVTLYLPLVEELEEPEELESVEVEGSLTYYRLLQPYSPSSYSILPQVPSVSRITTLSPIFRVPVMSLSSSSSSRTFSLLAVTLPVPVL